MISISIQSVSNQDTTDLFIEKDWEPCIKDYEISWKDEFLYQIKNQLIQMKWDLQTYFILFFSSTLLFLLFLFYPFLK
jgi:hypothetical protein